MHRLKLAAVALAAFSLAGCVSVVAVPAGPMKAGTAEVTLGREWADVSPVMGAPVAAKKARLLSIDGPSLNRLYVSYPLTAGDAIVPSASKEKPAPAVRANMSVTERVEFVADSVAAMGYQRVEALRTRPATYGGKPAVRFDLTASTPEGLEIAGSALAAEVDAKTYLILFLAPAEHYYGATAAEVEGVMASAKIAG